MASFFLQHADNEGDVIFAFFAKSVLVKGEVFLFCILLNQ